MIITDEATVEEAWKRLKWGMFSASEIDVLNGAGKGGSAFSTGAMTYIEDVANEGYCLFNDDENVETWAMRKGKMKEPEAFGHYRRIVGGLDNLEYFGGANPLFQKYCEDSGASPDCIAWGKEKGTVAWGAEFKCPNRKTHWMYLRKIKDQWDLKQIDSTYYGQCQFGMMTFKADLWHWCSYNEYYPFKDQMLIIEIAPDIPYQKNLAIRLKMAKKLKWELIEEMRSR